MNEELEHMLLVIKTELEESYENNGNDLRSYFSDPLDYTYSIGSNGDYLSVKVYITLGGPNIWIDTNTGCICGAWGAERCEICLPDDIRDEIDEIFSEWFNWLFQKY